MGPAARQSKVEAASGRSVRYAAPRPASIEWDCERTLDDKFSAPRGEEREQIDAREKISAQFESMEHTPTDDVTALSVGGWRLSRRGPLVRRLCREERPARTRGRRGPRLAALPDKKEEASHHPLSYKSLHVINTARCLG